MLSVGCVYLIKTITCSAMLQDTILMCYRVDGSTVVCNFPCFCFNIPGLESLLVVF